ncbi:MAG: homocysteine S-methyltransferase family protein [Syntrophales bacterium]|jgi:5-methyltetrahydrofolate--homocysteine methyltransferase|nr:homocysteine S-methyltransferase family protein [Syntrophales bacterium]MDD4339668.1 homocysteine S-methyltransferase family protein [Syntrophales bacterium]HOG06929.1 homocysteine S-methyltransferase family protein [Syntrophales bacterium]HOS76804.1 homocysteine S-methyltransferase family protein [Syntrophales bacterium]
MKKIRDEVKEGRVLISDGAWGTMLQQGGFQPGECLELWNVEMREAVLAVAGAYIQAGADMIETNSFGGNRYKLALYGLEDRVGELNAAAAAISRQAAGPGRHVLGSIGPTGKLLIMQEVTEADLFEAFCDQVVALEQGGADACCIETFADIDEARCAVRAAKERTDLEIICTFSFDKTPKGEYRTIMGVTPARMAGTMVEAGADIIGANCGIGMARMVEVVREIRAVDRLTPILVHANAGLPVMVGDRATYPETPEVTAAYFPRLVEAGANIIGGCCGTTPAHIAALVGARRQQS